MISYPKKITYRRLSTEFGRLMEKAQVGRASTYILLREDDMIYLAFYPCLQGYYPMGFQIPLKELGVKRFYPHRSNHFIHACKGITLTPMEEARAYAINLGVDFENPLKLKDFFDKKEKKGMTEFAFYPCLQGYYTKYFFFYED